MRNRLTLTEKEEEVTFGQKEEERAAESVSSWKISRQDYPFPLFS
jgi:hypothetical protein